jgi:lipoprotein-anchoring transpeptidase ErfK/SrfK
MPDTPERYLHAAQVALKQGDRHAARELLQQAVSANPADYRAWLWLSGITPSPRASLDYARRAADLKPNDPTVARALAWAEGRAAALPASPAASPAPAAPAPPQQPAATLASRPARPAAKAARPSRPATSRTAPPRRRPGRGRFLVLSAAAIAVIALLSLATLAWAGWPARLPVAAQRAAEVSAADPGAATATPALGRTQDDSKGQAGAVHFDAPSAATSTPVTPSVEEKAIAPGSEGTARPTWTSTPVPTSTPTETPVPTITPSPFPTVLTSASAPPLLPMGVGPADRWVDVNLSSQTLAAYEGNRQVFTTLISSGTWQFPTVTGQFRIYLRYEAQTMDGYALGYDYYLPNVPYVMYFYEDYALHGTYWHNNFGTPMSHGCVNLATPDAEWLYNWTSIGTLVNVHY